MPSLHAVQWRNIRPSARWAFTFDASRAFSSRSLQAASAHAGKTSDTKAIHLPSGDHVMPDASVAIVVSLFGSPPAAGIDPDLRPALAVRDKRQLLAVGRPPRTVFGSVACPRS